jgi:hypothetical protein
MKPAETIKKILDICTNTPNVNVSKDTAEEVQRLDDVITIINDLCDNCINDQSNENEFDDE